MDPATHVIIVGGSEDELAPIRAAARGLSNVRFTGQLPPVDAWQYLVAADVGVVPYLPAGRDTVPYQSPLKIFEYMAAGCAIVASDLPHLHELLVDGRNATLVPPGDPDALAAAITALAKDPQRMRELAATGRREIQGRTWERRAKLILEFLEKAGAGT